MRAPIDRLLHGCYKAGAFWTTREIFMADNTKVELSQEFLARISAGLPRNAATPGVEPLNADFDRNSPVPPDGAASEYLYAAARPGRSA